MPYWYLNSIALHFVVPAAVAVAAFFLMRYWSGRVMACGKCRTPFGNLESLRCAKCNADLREVGVVRRGTAVCWATAIVIAIWMFLWPIGAGFTLFRAMNAVPQIGTHTPQANLGRPLSGGYADGVISANMHLRSGWFGRPGEIIRREWTAEFHDCGGVTVASVTVDLKESTVVYEHGDQRTRKAGPLTLEEFTDWLGHALPNVRDPYWLREQAEEIMLLTEEWTAIEWSAAAARQRFHDLRARTMRHFELASPRQSGNWLRMRAGAWSMFSFEPAIPRQLFYYGYLLFSLVPAIIILLVGRRLLHRQFRGDEAKRGRAEARP